MVNASQTPAWSLADEYESYEDRLFLDDIARVEACIAELEGMGGNFAQALASIEGLEIPVAASTPENAATAELLERCRSAMVLAEEASMLQENTRVYVSCRLSVDGSDIRGKELRGEIGSRSARLLGAAAPLELLLTLAPDSFFSRFLDDGRVARQRFRLEQLRKLRDQRLSLESERLLSAFSTDGFHAWGNLYDSLSGTLSCSVEQDGKRMSMGIAEAASLLRSPDRPRREAAWRAVNGAYAGHEETLAAILDALAGWRLVEYGLRSTRSTVHFLDPSLHQNRMRRSTLDALISVVDESKELGREALRLQAKLLGVERLAPWDILAGAPELRGAEGRPLDFEAALALVARAYAGVHPSMAEFVRGEAAARHIEARALAAKRPGAYCTEFPKSRSTRVFMTYGGSLSDVSTLAHELGHAYHSSLLADLPLPEADYPMSLAETASTFAETLLGELLAEEAEDDRSLLPVAWSDARNAATFLLNIPARLAFESRFYERRKERPLGPETLSALMREAWADYYGDALSEYDGSFWCSKLHFYKTGVSFYNYPYVFGYLFSLGLYARRETLGGEFHARYAALLRDTGRMEVEELARRHLGVDLSAPEFWRGSLSILRRKVERFGSLASRLDQAAR